MALKVEKYDTEVMRSASQGGLDTRGWDRRIFDVLKKEVEEDGEIRFDAESIAEEMNETRVRRLNEYIYGLKQLLHISIAAKQSNIKKEKAKKILSENGINLEELLKKPIPLAIKTAKAKDGTPFVSVKKAKALNYRHKNKASFEACVCSKFGKIAKELFGK